MSIEQDPPGYSQPTLPPSEPRGRYAIPLLGAGLLAVMGTTLAAYIHLPHGEQATHLQAPPASPVAPTLEAIAERFPSVTAERACAADGARIPLVLHSAITRQANLVPDASIIPGAVSGPVAAARVAVLRTVTMDEPRASIGEPGAGHYEGELVVFDAASNRSLCQARVSAWSSSTILQRGVSARILRDDFATRIEAALTEAAGRIGVALDL
jgi:hypothetical protein